MRRKRQPKKIAGKIFFWGYYNNLKSQNIFSCSELLGSAQGIISFVKASDYFPEYAEQAEKMIHWTIGNLYNKRESEFFYRKGRFWRWNYSLMRWCNAWMLRAMAEFFFKLQHRNIQFQSKEKK